MISKNTVSTLGSLHDLFLSNPHYGLKEFISALYQFKPDVILSEVLTENSNAGDASIDGGIEQAIVYAYAKAQAVPVKATDWFNEALIKEMFEENSKVTPKLMETLQAMSVFRESFKTGSLLELHSEKIQDYMRELYKVYEENGLMASRKRNDRIIANIKNELAKLQRKRVLIVYGLDHKFFIDDRLKEMDSIEFLPVSSWFKSETSKVFKISESLRSDIIENLKISEALLESRLKTQDYIQELDENLRAKLPRFQNWISNISKL